jgi:uncharacterized repeat protein (TIGR03806 family)
MKRLVLPLLAALLAAPLSAQCGETQTPCDDKPVETVAATQKGCGEGSSIECGSVFDAKRAGEIVDRVRTPGCANIARHGLRMNAEFVGDRDQAQHLVARIREAPDRATAIRMLLDLSKQDEKAKTQTMSESAARALAKRVRAPGCSSGGRNFVFQEMEAITDIDVAAALAARVREAADLDAATAMLVKASSKAKPSKSVAKSCGEGCAESCGEGCASTGDAAILASTTAKTQDENAKPTAKSAPLDAAAALELAKQVRAPGCSSGGSNLLFQQLDAVTEIGQAEALAARVREARDLRAAAGEILFAAMDTRTAALPTKLAAKLTETGFFADVENRKMAPGFVPYEVNVPLWSDGAKKARFFRLPEGKKVEFTRDGEWRFPDGTTFLQTLYFPAEDEDDELVVETRVMVKRGKDPLFGIYVWNDDADDGALTENGDEFYANHGNSSQLWKVARTKDCTKCHNEAAGLILGLNTAQLNRELERKPGTHQLKSLAAAGHLTKLPADISDLPALPNPHDATKPLDERARAYLHVHCSTCHQPGGPGSGTMDLRTQTEFLATGIVRSPSHGLRRGQVRPGRPERSRLIGRMASVDWDRMPDLLTTVPDDKAIAMLSDWVRSMKRTKPMSKRTALQDAPASEAASAPSRKYSGR